MKNESSKSRYLIYYCFLTLMILSSIIFGIPTNKGWWFVGEFEYAIIQQFFYVKIIDYAFLNILYLFLMIIVTLSHLLIIFYLPFKIESPHFPKLIIWIPMIYLVSFIFRFLIFGLLLIPFTFLWLIMLYMISTDKRLGYWKPN